MASQNMVDLDAVESRIRYRGHVDDDVMALLDELRQRRGVAARMTDVIDAWRSGDGDDRAIVNACLDAFDYTDGTNAR